MRKSFGGYMVHFLVFFLLHTHEVMLFKFFVHMLILDRSWVQSSLLGWDNFEYSCCLMIILGNLKFVSISFWVDLRYLSILWCVCFIKLLQVTSRVSLGRRFGEESFLETLTHSKNLFPLPYIFCCHFIWFSANILVLERSLNTCYLSLLLAGNFLCLHRNFPSFFLVFCSVFSEL